MKRFLKLFAKTLVCLSLAVIACNMLGIGGEFTSYLYELLIGGGIALAVGPGVEVVGGAAIGDIDTNETLDDVLKREIVKVRPSDTPLDTITRELNNTESAQGFEVGGWEVGTRDITDKVTSANTGGGKTDTIKVDKPIMWLPGDIIQAPKYKGSDGKPLTMYVLGLGSDRKSVSVISINADTNLPALKAADDLLRVGCAASEKQATSIAWNMDPSTRKNYCQIHMAQVEETVLHGLAKKKVDANFGLYKEQVLWDFKRSMELTNLFGIKGAVTNDNGEKVYFSEGVFNQIVNEWEYEATKLTNADWVGHTRRIFDGNNGSDRRMLFAGSGFIEKWAKCTDFQKQLDAGKTEIVCGVRVNVIETNFGQLLLKPMGSLFMGDKADSAIVLDMGYVVKKVFEPLHIDALELSKSGQKRVEAQRIIETYCLFLENLPVHSRFVLKG